MIYKKWYSSPKLSEDYGYELFKKKIMGKTEKNDVKVGFGKIKIKHGMFVFQIFAQF